ncbi:GYD domain-containing protein [Microvirga puerhi]|uniref:GYD domain-containing protein n=1 Tax=Microvirga puerhi TaxID=2876078 RepID=A0ABS7VJP6_9HYPH|nr:GYD domain-containing protein [Microvirga puerhi]MBZ6075376.1 GYD domain-containing protein [Microvirga puerhi]
MPLFITQGRYTHNAMKGMLASPEDRTEMVSKLFEKAGGKLRDYFFTFGEYDFLVITEGPMDGAASALIVAAASGGVTDMKTTVAMTSAEMKEAFTRAGNMAGGFRAAGASKA